MKEETSTPKAVLKIVLAAVTCFLFFYAFGHVHGQTPSLVVSAGTGNLVVTSDTQGGWKQFVVTGGSAGSYQVLWAESNGTTGGIFQGTVVTTSSAVGLPIGPPVPPAPAPSDLPLNTLTTAAAAAIAGVPSDQAAKMSDLYDGLATAIDKGVIASPLQLQIGTGTQLLSVFKADELANFKNLTAAVNGWLDGQQCAGKLTPDRMDRYAAAYHATAKAIRPATMPKPATGAPGMSGSRGTEPAPAEMVESKLAAPRSPCADGHCPVNGSPAPQYRFRIFGR